MFTGLVEEVGRVASLEAGDMFRLSISASRVLDGTRMGDSVSVNGVCLTVNEVDGGTLVFQAMPETLRRSSLGDLVDGSPEAVVDVTDVWTFARTLGTRDPNWQLVATEAAQ